ncbi:DNA adenine methylase [Oxynema sp. CENA135]|uniref:DNA adenine methylase n=1 Tax=Oxynema sp. CENA135 TaxID=984206 RepID=UPI00351C3961
METGLKLMPKTDLLPSNKVDVNSKIVNISTVPQRSPFRYAGGKTWLIPKIRQWLNEREHSSKELIEPFAGGGIVSLTAACENLVHRVTMVEKDEGVAAVWQIVLNGGAQWLANRIVNFQLTPESAKEVIEKANESLESLAFATIVKNRVNRGGILADGASFVKKGENGKGIRSRWYPETLKKRILAIGRVKDKINFIQGDGFDVCQQNSSREDVIYFIDPPYTKTGKRLYRYSEVNHQQLFALAARLKGDFLMTYNDAAELREMGKFYNFEMKEVAMKNTHHAKKSELLISKNLAWLSSEVTKKPTDKN